MEFKNNLIELRHEKDLTQKQLAEKTGLSLSIIRKWETGDREPSGKALIILSKFFEVTTDYLLGLEDKARRAL